MASIAKEPFSHPDWIFQTKLDGYRAIAVIDSLGKARIWSRNRLPLEQKFPTIQDAAEELNLRSAILDGEIVALGSMNSGKGCFIRVKSTNHIEAGVFATIPGRE